MLAYVFISIAILSSSRGAAALIGCSTFGMVPVVYGGIIALIVSGRIIGIGIEVLAASVVLAIVALAVRGALGGTFSVASTISAAFVITAPATVLWFYFEWGLTNYVGSWYFDGWNYVVYAQYLIDLLNQSLKHAPIYEQFVASGMPGTRYASASLIALITLVTGAKDAASAVGPFLAVTVFVLCCSSVFLASTLWQSRVKIFVFAALVVLSGALLGAIQANNFDTLLLLSMAPAALGWAFLAEPKSRCSAIALGITAAASICIQIELAPFALLPAACVLVWRIVPDGLAAWSRWIVVSFASFLLPCGPWLPFAVRFLQGQLRSLSRGDTPGGGYFPAFMDPQCWFQSMWGMYNPYEHCNAIALGSPTLWATVVLSILVIVGATKSLKVRMLQPIILSWSLLVGVAAVLSLYTKYPYAAFKFVVLAAPLSALLVVAGASISRRAFLLLAAVPIALLALVSAARQVSFDTLVRVKNIEDYRQIAGPEGPISVYASGDTFLWSLFFLRGQPFARLIYELPFFEAVRTVYGNTLPPSADTREYLLTDPFIDLSCVGHHLERGNKVFRIWRTKNNGVFFVSEIENPLGVDLTVLGRMNWLGGSIPAVFHIRSEVATNAAVFTTLVQAGPSMAERRTRTLEFSGAYNGTVQFEEQKVIRLPLALEKGTTLLSVTVREAPTTTLSSGDPRPLMVRMSEPQICF